MVSVKQGGIKYNFLSLWYDATWDWTQVSWAIGEHYKYKDKIKWNLTNRFLSNAMQKWVWKQESKFSRIYTKVIQELTIF